MTIIYDVLLKHHPYQNQRDLPPKYTIIFYDESRKAALEVMQKYVKQQGFTTPDKKYSIADVILRERESTGKEISITPYHKLFNTVTNELLK